MKMLKGMLNLFTGGVFALITVLAAVLCFSLLVYPTNEYVAVIAALVLAFGVAFFLNMLRRQMFGLGAAALPLNAIITTTVLAVAMVAVFWIPTRTFVSSGTVADGYGMAPEFITIHTGDQLAVYVHQPEASNGEAPVLFITGGPGGAPTRSVRDYLTEYAKQGYTVYTYDPIGCGNSPLPQSNTSYAMTHEVDVVGDIMAHYGMEKVSLIASSYGGNVAARFIAQHPEKVNAYLSVDTAPLYSMDENYPGQADDAAFMQTVEMPRVKPGSAEMRPITEVASFRQLARIVYGMNLMKTLGKDDIPYGSTEEYDYLISIMVSAATHTLAPDGRPSRYMNYLSNTLVTASLESSPDFTEALRAADTPPVLVVQPEFGVVPWQIHYQYRDYFADTRFLAAPGCGHGVWGTPAGRELLVRNGDALFRGEPIPDEYTMGVNPFPIV